MVSSFPFMFKKRIKVIFLDIDGVLNGYSWWTRFVYPIIRKLHLLKKVNKYYDLFGVRTYRVFLLSIIVKITGAKIVLSSSWRHGWNTPYEKCGDRMKELKDKLKKFKLEVIDITPSISTKRTSSDRGVEIKWWLDHALSKGYIVESFVILDDEKFDLTEFEGKGLIITSRNGEVKGHWSENTRLKPKHVFQAIRILNKPD